MKRLTWIFLMILPTLILPLVLLSINKYFKQTLFTAMCSLAILFVWLLYILVMKEYPDTYGFDTSIKPKAKEEGK